jgi:3-hydroxymyristoyl/3-hydroxydecanoyl-(acyl carrier protein) dehydratase
VTAAGYRCEIDAELQAATEQLQSHDWVRCAMVIPPQAAASIRATIVVVPSEAGVKVLRRHGKRFLVHRWEQQVGAGDGIHWALLNDLPASGAAVLERLHETRLFPRILGDAKAAAHEIELLVEVPYDLDIFEGHFPSIPIVPGVVQVGWAVNAARSRLGLSGRFLSLEKIKFRRIVRPGDRLLLKLQYDPRRAQLRFRFSDGSTLVSSGEVLLAVADA